MKDVLEDKVDKKYYISEEQTERFISSMISKGTLKDGIWHSDDCNKDYSNTVRGGQRLDRQTSMGSGNKQIGVNVSNKGSQLDNYTDVANTLLARDYKGFGNQRMTGVMDIAE